MIRFTCPHCRAALRISAEKAGKNVGCPRCRQHFRLSVPQPTPDATALAEPAPPGRSKALWYYVPGSHPVGPVAEEVLKQLVASGRLLPRDLVRKKGTQQWMPADRAGLTVPSDSRLEGGQPGPAPLPAISPTPVPDSPEANQAPSWIRHWVTQILARRPTRVRPRITVTGRGLLGAALLLLLIALVVHHRKAVVNEGAATAPSPGSRTDETGGSISEPHRSWADLGSVKLPERADFLAVSPDGRMLATRGVVVSVYDVATLRPTARLEKIQGPPGPIAFAPDGRYLAWLRESGQAGEVVLWDLIASQVRTTVRAFESPAPGRQFAISPDSRLLATADLAVGGAGFVCLWDLPSGQRRSRLPGRGPIAFSRDGGTLLMQSCPPAGLVLWDVSDHGQRAELARNLTGVLSSSFGQAGAQLFLATGEGVEVWDLASASRQLMLRPGLGERPGTSPKPVVKALTFSVDDRTAAIIVCRTVQSGGFSEKTDSLRLWDMPSGKTACLLQGEPCKMAAFSRDGKLLAVLQDKVIRLWTERAGDEGAFLFREGDTDASPVEARGTGVFDYAAKSRQAFVDVLRGMIKDRNDRCWGQVLAPVAGGPSYTYVNCDYQAFLRAFGRPHQGFEPDSPHHLNQVWTYSCSDGPVTLRVEVGCPVRGMDGIMPGEPERVIIREIGW